MKEATIKGAKKERRKKRRRKRNVRKKKEREKPLFTMNQIYPFFQTQNVAK